MELNGNFCALCGGGEGWAACEYTLEQWAYTRELECNNMGHIPFACLCSVWLEKVHYLFMQASSLLWVQLPDGRTDHG